MAIKVYLDADDVTDHLAKLLQSPTNKKPHYNAITTACIGRDGTNYVLKNFKVSEDLLLNIFDTCTLKDLGITGANSQYYKLTPTTGTPRVTRVSDADFTVERKGNSGRTIAGRRIEFPVPTVAAGGLRKYFGKAAARLTATLMFPNIVTIPQIAMWFVTHLATNRVDSIPYFKTPSGSKVLIPAYPASLADFDKMVGEFSAATKAKLPDDAEVVEATP